MSTPGQGSIFGSNIIYGAVDYGPTFGRVYRPVTQRRTFIATGDDTIQDYDQYVRYLKTVPAAFAVLLPDLGRWMTQPIGGFPLLLKDAAQNAGTYNITVTPYAGQTIDGYATFTIAADGAALNLIPKTDMTGWEVW